MSKQLPNYLRTHRKRSGLSQAEVAFLLGCRGGAKVSRYERHRRRPPLPVALAYEAIFGVPVAELFAGLSDDVERTTHERAKRLHRQLAEHRHSPGVAEKLAALERITTPKVVRVSHPPHRDR